MTTTLLRANAETRSQIEKANTCGTYRTGTGHSPNIISSPPSCGGLAGATLTRRRNYAAAHACLLLARRHCARAARVRRKGRLRSDAVRACRHAEFQIQSLYHF